MSRFYVRPDSIKNRDTIYVDGEEAHHILDVMRLKRGEEVTAFDGSGKEYRGVVDDVYKRGLSIKIRKIKEPRRTKDYKITLAQAVPKLDKMDYIIQKTIELGVDSIIPMRAARTIVRLNKERFLKRRKRWERIAREAAKQCGKNSLTTVEEYSDIKDILETTESYDLVLMPCLAPFKKNSLKKSLAAFRGKSILVLVGPEGGFDPSEIDAASKKDIVFVSLGENVLKCDTAAITAIAMINYALSDL